VIHAFISTGLDYCNSIYMDIYQGSLAHLQMVQNAAARVLQVEMRAHYLIVVTGL